MTDNTPGMTIGQRLLLLWAAVMVWVTSSCQPNSRRELVVYTSQDQVYATPILKEFERETGIQVKAVYDSEAVKTVFLVNRLIAERHHPICDLFWNNEELRTHQLKNRGLIRGDANLASFGYRSRQIVVNTNLIQMAEAPRTMMALTNSVWRGNLAMAYPMFGTTATHFLALRQKWGEKAWINWCRQLRENDPMVVDGNSLVVQLVGKGEVALGITDSDDVLSGQRKGYPILAVDLDEEAFYIRNTVGIMADGPHPKAAKRLFEYLQSGQVLERLKSVGAIQGETPPVGPSVLNVDWEKMIKTQKQALDQLKKIFLR